MNEKELFRKIYKIAAEMGFPIYVVGGYVRDLILGEPGKDIDFVLVGDAMKFADIIAQKLEIKKLVRYKRYGTFMAHYKGYDLEFVNARSESYNFDSRNPVTKLTDLPTDLSRRDFTINALAMDISGENYGEIIDNYNGQKDLKKGLIKTPLPPDKTFEDDPLRMMRAIRFACRFQFDIDPETFESIKRNAHRLSIISVERIQVEFNKIILSKVNLLKYYPGHLKI